MQFPLSASLFRKPGAVTEVKERERVCVCDVCTYCISERDGDGGNISFIYIKRQSARKE